MNRIVGNVVIVDSAMGNNFILTSANSIINLNEFKVVSFTFWAADTTGSVIFSGVDTTNHLVRISNSNNNPATTGIVINGVPFSNLKVPVLASGTAWIYFK